MTAPRPAPGELIFRCPECPLCGNETETDGDSFRCYQCRCSWSMRGGDAGQWDDPGEPICRKVFTHQLFPALSGRCLLGEGHKGGEHHNGTWAWRSDLLAHSLGFAETEAAE